MTSKKLKIIYVSDSGYIAEKQYEYTGAFMSLYKQVELSKDPEFISTFKERWNLNDIEYRSLESDVLAVRKSKEAADRMISERIECISRDLAEKEVKDVHKAFKLRNKLSKLKKKVGGECCFGKTSVLRKISKECNREERDEEKLTSLRNEWQASRVRGIFIKGESNQRCNRFFDLSRLDEGVVVYKPNQNNRVEIRFNPKHYRQWREQFSRIAELSRLKKDDPSCDLAVSVRLTETDIVLTYDAETINGYSIDKRSRNKEAKEIKDRKLPEEVQTKQIKELYARYHRKLEEEKLEGKMENRVIGVDMNPNYFGYAILDVNPEDGSYKVINTGCFDLTSLNRRRHFRSGSKAYRHIQNKRHYEIDCMVKTLFRTAMHYKCSKFIIEDLEFKKNDRNYSAREANRQTRNVWCREQITNRITRRCLEKGVILEKICAVYSSFVGNIRHDYIDPCNAAIETARRGALKYRKGAFYPEVSEKDLSTLGTMFGDGLDMTVRDWRELYQSSKALVEKRGLTTQIWRKHTGDVSVGHGYRVCSMDSCRSRIRRMTFDRFH